MFSRLIPVFIVCAALVSGCQSNPDKTNSATAGVGSEYTNIAQLDCPRIVKYHRESQVDLIKMQDERFNKNVANVAIGVIGMVSGFGAFSVNNSSKSERDLEMQISALETIAEEKNCELVAVDPEEVEIAEKVQAEPEESQPTEL